MAESLNLPKSTDLLFMSVTAKFIFNKSSKIARIVLSVLYFEFRVNYQSLKDLFFCFSDVV